MQIIYLLVVGLIGGWPAFWVALLTLVLFS